MARICRHFQEVAAAFALLAGLFLARAFAEDQGPNAGTDLYDRPVLAVDPGMHTAAILAQAVDREGKFAVTGGADRTVRIWSVADGKLLNTIWIPVGPDPVGAVSAVAISPDGSIVAAGGQFERMSGHSPIYLFDRESGAMTGRIAGDLPYSTSFLTFSVDGRYLAAALAGKGGLRVFDRDKKWEEVFRDDDYGGATVGAAFAPDGRLATTSDGADGTIRIYSPNFRLVEGPTKTPGGSSPLRVAFSPDGRKLAVGYGDDATVDILDAATLKRMPGPKPDLKSAGPEGLAQVAWSRDGGTLYAAGTAFDGGFVVLLAWDRAGLGREKRFTYCQSESASGLDALPGGRILISTAFPCLGVLNRDGGSLWARDSPLPDFRAQFDKIRVSDDGAVVDFGFGDVPGTVKPLKVLKDGGRAFNDELGTPLRFDVRSLHLSRPDSSDNATFAPKQDGLPLSDWRFGYAPVLAGRPLPLEGGPSWSLAIAPDAKRFYLGANEALAAYDEAGAVRWRRLVRNPVWAVNASRDGRIVVAAYGDGTIRWRRADDGRELLALQVFSNKTDWVLWTPEGFYAATTGAREFLKWVTNHGPDEAARTSAVSAIPKLYRPDALRHVLEELETVRALGIAELAEARQLVQISTGSGKPPGAVLHLLAIGIDHFGDKAGGLHLDYAAGDAHDVANALVTSQAGETGRYTEVKPRYLFDSSASHAAILQALDDMTGEMRRSNSDQDLAVVLISSHGEMINDQFYLVPFGVDLSTPAAIQATSIPVTEFAEKIKSLAKRGKVLLLLDACHAGAFGPSGVSPVLDATSLQNAVSMDTVTILTSSTKGEVSQEDPVLKHGFFTEAFLDTLSGRAGPTGRRVISTLELAERMEDDLEQLTHGKQHLGMHVNYGAAAFVVGQ
jgi:WD40 repeat protein